MGTNSALQVKVMHALHDSAIGGHSGFSVTYQRIKRAFAWPQMKQGIKDFVAGCTICQQAKAERVKYPGLLAPLAVHQHAWQTVSIDFIEGLPRSSGFDCILVVVDKFSRYAHFVPLAHPFSAAGVASAYMNNVYKLHGMPHSIVSDRDRIFTSTFWKELFRITDTQLSMSSAYHPQSDGQTEQVNQCLEAYLRCFVHGYPRKWVQWLALAEFWYNTCPHSTLKKSPFEVLYGHAPRQLGIDRLEARAVPDVAEWLHEREQMRAQLQQHLVRAQLRMKNQADKNRTEREFQVSDWVFLKLQPYIQKLVFTRANQKLALCYFGPYQVIRRIGSMAYELALPDTAKVHLVFHVSQLKQRVPPSEQVLSELSVEDDTVTQPGQIFEHRQYRRGAALVPQILVQWTGMPASLATWENEQALRMQYPDAPACPSSLGTSWW